MEQEQKPLPFVITHPKDLSVSDIFNYVNEANAEIRRLQEVVSGLEDATSYTRTDTIPDVAELQRQNAVLKTLFRKLFDEASWTVYDSIQNEATAAGIVIPHSVTQEDIDDVRFDSSECELGDTVFMMSDWMQNDDAKMPIPSKAEVAREFYDHVIDAAAEICEATGDQQEYEGLEQSEVYPTALDIVLKEWEEADGKR